MIYLCGKEEDKIKEILKKYNKIRKLDNLLEKYWQSEVME